MPENESPAEIDILVVDDSLDAAESLAEVLSLDGYVVRIATDGQEALHLAETLSPHCVLLDCQMPGLDGLDLTRRLRERYGDDVILVAVTGHSADAPRVKATFDLVDHYFTKPIELDQLRKIFSGENG